LDFQADKTQVTSLQSAPFKSNKIDDKSAGTNEDPNLSLPIPRYNTMLTVLRNTLYMYVFPGRNQLPSVDHPPYGRYGGIYERGSREYTLDDFYSIQLDKLDKCTCLKESAVIVPDVAEESSSSDDDDDDDDDSGGEDDCDDEGGEGTLVGDEVEESGIKKAIAVPVLEVADEEGWEGEHKEEFEEIHDEKVLTSFKPALVLLTPL
jgi:hypothetical protein